MTAPLTSWGRTESLRSVGKPQRRIGAKAVAPLRAAESRTVEGTAASGVELARLGYTRRRRSAGELFNGFRWSRLSQGRCPRERCVCQERRKEARAALRASFRPPFSRNAAYARTARQSRLRGANLTALHGFEARPTRLQRARTGFASTTKMTILTPMLDFRAEPSRAEARERRLGRAAPPATGVGRSRSSRDASPLQVALRRTSRATCSRTPAGAMPI